MQDLFGMHVPQSETELAEPIEDQILRETLVPSRLELLNLLREVP
jgi:hypothetical protein